MRTEQPRDARRQRWLADLAQDLRFGLRNLTRQRAFALTTILTLALGIGANTAIFSIVNGVVLEPLPFADPERLVQLRGSSPLVPRGDAVNNLPEIRRQSTSFEALVGYDVSAGYLQTGASRERIMTVRAERDFFHMLGATALAGRPFGPADPIGVAVISEAFWRQRLNSDPAVVGTMLSLDDQLLPIVGVMPAAFQFPYHAASLLPDVGSAARTDAWITFELPTGPRVRLGNITGRLKPNVSREAAESELAVIARRLESQYPESNTGRGLYLEPLSEVVIGTMVRRPLLLVFGAVALVLVIACANVTNLALVRMTLRRREVAVRSAIGAGRFRLVRQFLTESLLLSLIGGALGLGLASLTTSWLLQALSTRIPRAHEVGLDWRVFVFLLIVCVVVAAASGLAPALFAARTGGQAALQSEGRATMSSSQRRLRDGLVVAEVALTFILGLGAAILVRELVRLRHTDSGMVTSKVLTVHLGHRMSPRSDVQRFYDIAHRVEQLPGVRSAGFTQMLPLQNWGWTANSDSFTGRGRPVLPPPPFQIELRYVTPGYFRALGIPVRGRTFTDGDTRDTPRVILINETLARRQFGNLDPIGTEMNRGTIIGVVSDVRQVNLDKPASPEIYFPAAQNWTQLPELGMSLVVSTQQGGTGLIDAIRATIREVDPNLAVFSVKTMDDVVGESLSAFTLFLGLMTSFAALALLLAVTGTYGIVSYIATSRVREFAIRMALGADRQRVMRLVLGQGARLTAIGMGIGLAGAIAAAPLLTRLPITVGPLDLTSVALVAIVIGLAAIVACLVPALRAGGLSPMAMLRSE